MAIKVLVVDDSATDRKLAGRLLEKQSDSDIVYAADGAEALAVVESERPSLVVTDMQMPNIDGLELVRALARDYPSLPVVLMTGHGSEDIAAAAMLAGAVSYVPKRHLAARLVPAVSRALAAATPTRRSMRLFECLRSIHVEYALPNDSGLICSLRMLLQEKAQGMGVCGEASRMSMGLALEEALLNAMYHGNLGLSSELRQGEDAAFYALARKRAAQPPWAQRRIFVSAHITPEEFSCVIRDEGEGFDTSKLPDPSDTSNMTLESGRGLMLIQMFMDEVHYSSRGNQVRMTFRARGGHRGDP